MTISIKLHPVTHGIAFGNALALIISYTHWHSILWACVNGLFGWFYVIYHAIRY